VAAPALRRRLKLRGGAVLAGAALAPAGLCVALPRSRRRDAAVCVLQMWAYLAAYEIPNDDPEALAARARVRYPIVADRIIGLGRLPTLRFQRAFARPGQINRFERVLVWCHWMWFLVPHGSVAYVFLRRPERFPSAAARIYAVFDLGAVFYQLIPTAPPWWASARGHLGPGEELPVRRMMIEYGEQFWGERWTDLYDVLGGNPLAAMPSLHFATSLMAAQLLSEVGPVAGAISAAYAATLGVALVYLGEHYAIDLVAGAALAETVRRGAGPVSPAARVLARALSSLQARAAIG
jgi:membrane-associated phospholipid phosphatase